MISLPENASKGHVELMSLVIVATKQEAKFITSLENFTKLDHVVQ